jgi:hypothetical protein
VEIKLEQTLNVRLVRKPPICLFYLPNTIMFDISQILMHCRRQVYAITTVFMRPFYWYVLNLPEMLFNGGIQEITLET